MEKDKSSKRTREERDHHKHRSRDGDDHRSSRDSDRNHRSDRDSKPERFHEPRDRHRSHRSRSREPDYDREGSKERSHDREWKRERSHDHRSEREGSRDRDKYRERKRERSEDHDEELIERRHKRKERGGSEGRDGDLGRTKVSEDRRKERRRFGDKAVEDGNEANGIHSERRFENRQVKDEDDEGYDRAGEDRVALKTTEFKVEKEEHYDEQFGNSQGVNFTDSRNGPVGNVATLDSVATRSRSVPEISVSLGHPLPTKVSMISTTHENKGVNITGSHEVHGKSSTDGTSSTAGKSGSLSLDAIAKAKKALQMQKELSEKLKKITQLNKGAVSSNSNATTNQGTNEGLKTLSTSDGAKQGAVPSTPVATTIFGTAANSTTLSAAVNASGKSLASGTAGLADVISIEAVKRAQELTARMGFSQDPQFPPLINMFPGQMTNDVAISQKPTKAPVLRLDALGREIDEHGNVVNVTKPSNLSTLKVNINKQKKEAFQILKPDMDEDTESNPHFDPSMGVNKTKLLRPKRMNFQFVEEGKWSRDAEHIKLKSKFGEAQAKEQKAKLAQLAKAKAAPDINPNLIEVSERVIIKEKPKEPIPEVEWWDVNLLHSGTYGDNTIGVMPEDRLKLEKMTIYVEHPRPIEPPAEPPTPPPQPLKLTVKERKKLRTQQRLQREKDRQEMIRQGLLEPPKPKVKMSNMMKVLGSEATQDPTKLEMEIRSAAAEREQAHIDRNAARKLTPAERREKKERKLFDDPTTLDTIVTVYKINELSHPKARFKVDVNARENRLTGCAVISDGMNVVVVEGGNKSIKRYQKLMLRRIDWVSAVKDDEMDEDTNDDKPPNKCVLVWQGSVAKPAFNRFFIHECMTEAAARKIFADAGVGHYWDLAVNFSDDQI